MFLEFMSGNNKKNIVEKNSLKTKHKKIKQNQYNFWYRKVINILVVMPSTKKLTNGIIVLLMRYLKQVF